jgi:ankyrin repeat protein
MAFTVRGEEKAIDDDDKIDVRMKGIDNFTALHHASRRGHTEIVRLLLNESPPAEVNALTKVTLLITPSHINICTHVHDYVGCNW